MLDPNYNRYVRILYVIFRIVALYIIAVELNFLWLFGYSPGLNELKNPPYSVSSELYTANSVLIGKYYKENRSPVEYDSINPILIKALIATEDVRFYKHHGIDFYSIFSSLYSTAQGDKRGASTITQQLAKNLFNTRNRKSQGFIKYIPGVNAIVYKTKEWITALKLEFLYSKEKILEMYLNTVSFGNNTYGIKVAAKKYFNKSPAKLKTEEAALLIGMLKATSTYNPINHPDKALERRNIVLVQMSKDSVITEKELTKLLKKKIKLNLGSDDDENKSQNSYLRAAVKNWLAEWCEKNGYDIYADGLKIYTTIDSRLQNYAEEASREWMRTLQKRFYNHWQNENPWRDEDGEEIQGFLNTLAKRLPSYKMLVKKYDGNPDSINMELNRKKRMKVFTWKGEKDTTFSVMDSLSYYAKILQTGMMTLDPFNGHIKVWIGGIDHNYFKYDHVNQAKRQAGSTFKPFVYCAAIDKGYSPCDKFIDQPVTINYEEDGENKSWSPKNSDWVFTGYHMSLRWAMGKSCNSITAQLTEAIGWETVVEYANKIGIESPLRSVPSVGLGPNDVSIYEMVRAYGTFLNKGIKTEPILVTKITDSKGKIIVEFKAKQERVLSEETAWLMLYMFKGGIEEPGGTSQALWEYDLWKKGNEIGGKTGTTSNHSDGWYMGISKDLVSGVWVGADERSVHFRTSELGEGSKTALPIYGKFMEKVYRDPKTHITFAKFPKPSVKINKDYYCPTPRPKVDTSNVDSLLMHENLDSLVNELLK
jgi:penicillin-binding protein 1A